MRARRFHGLAAVGVVFVCGILVACGDGSRSGTTDSSANTTASSPTTSVPTTALANLTTSTGPSSTPTPTPTTATATSTSIMFGPAALARIAGESGRVTAWRVGDAVVVGPVTATPQTLNGAIIEPSGAVVPFPAASGPPGQVVRLADKVLTISAFGDNRASTVDLYSLTEHRWSKPAVPVRVGEYPYAFPAGDVVIIARHEINSSAEGPGAARLRLVHADGSVTEGALPTDPWALPQAGVMVVWTGREVVVYGADSSAFSTHLAHPTAYDPKTNTYRTLSNPPWAACEPTCAWISQHQGGDHQFAVWTGTRSLVFTAMSGSETTALHDPVRDAWEQIPNPPIPLSQPWIEAARRFVTVFATNAGPTHSNESDGMAAAPRGVAAVLDLETRTWSSARFAESVAGAGTSWSLCPVRIDSVLVVSTCAGMSDPIVPMALDPAAGRWSTATDRQQAQALIGLGPVSLDQLAVALRP